MNLPSGFQLLECPYDHSSIEYLGTNVLVCSRCDRRAEIRDGIVDFLFDVSEKLETEKVNEIHARDATADLYEARFTELRNALEIPPSIRAMNLVSTDRVIELGCGTGRLTRHYIDKVELVVAIDFSRKSLLRLGASLSSNQRAKCTFIRADVSKLPIRSSTFTKAVSFQVLEHLPSSELRKAVIREVARVLEPGNGELIFSVYNWSAAKKRDSSFGRGNNTAKEGHHPIGGKPVYFYNFEAGELTELITQFGFKIHFIRGLQMQFRGLRFIGRLALFLDRILSRTRLGLRWGHLLLVRARAETP